MSRFSETLVRLRRGKGLTQSALADAVGTTTGTVSRWERGEHPPRPTQLASLATALGSDEALLQDALRADHAKGQYEPLTLSGYLAEQQSFLDGLLDSGMQPNEITIWILGPSSLPVSYSPEVRDYWITNLTRGVEYRVIWYLDLLDPASLYALPPVLAQIGKQVVSTSGAGLIRHYAMHLFDRSGQNSTSLAVATYKECCSRDVPGNYFHRIIDSVAEPLRVRLQRYHHPFGTLVVYHHTNPLAQRLAGVSIHSLRAHVQLGDERTAYFFLNNQSSGELTALVTSFKAEHDPSRNENTETGKAHE